MSEPSKRDKAHGQLLSIHETRHAKAVAMRLCPNCPENVNLVVHKVFESGGAIGGPPSPPLLTLLVCENCSGVFWPTHYVVKQ